MASEEMQAFIDALRDHIPQDGSLTVEQHRAMHDGLLARRPSDEHVRIEETPPTAVAAEWVWAEDAPAAPRACSTALDSRLSPEHPSPAGLADVIANCRGLLDAGHAAASIAFGGES